MVHLRIRKIRQVLGWKQEVVAKAMNVTQQSYSCLEQGADNARLETLTRFCNATNVSLVFLLSDIPITDKTYEDYSQAKFELMCVENIALKNKVKAFSELILNQK